MGTEILKVGALLLGEFVVTIVLIYIYIKFGGIRIWRKDPNKPEHPEILTGGGLVINSIVIIFYLLFSAYLNVILAISLILSTLISMILGLWDEFVNIRIWKKVPLMLIPSIPIVVLSLVHPLWSHTTVLWFDFGVLYWIFVVPIVYMGFSNGANIIAGYDGLEGGIYILILVLYTIIGLISENVKVFIISMVLLVAVFAFELFNLPPAKVLLGNVGSFPIGGLLGIIPLIGHFEIVLPIIFLPHLIEFFFKVKYRGHTSVFGIVDKNGIIRNKDGIKSVLHWLISWGNMTEKKITLAMLGIESILCIVAFFSWYAFYIFT